MRRTKVDSSDERLLVSAMITDSAFLGKVSPAWQPKSFRSEWANVIANKCVGYYQRYGKAPNRAIEIEVRRWARKRREGDKTVELVESFLGSLDVPDGAWGVEYLLDVGQRYFNLVTMERLNIELGDLLAVGEIEEAEKLLRGYRRVEMGLGSFVDVLSDEATIVSSFDVANDALFKFRQDGLQRFMGDSFARDAFIAFLAPEKRGKTFWLLEVAWQAVRARCRVAFFSVGDMTLYQVMRRLLVRVAGVPWKTCQYSVPIDLVLAPGKSEPEVISEDKESKGLSLQTGLRAFRRAQKIIRSKESKLKLSVWPSGALSPAIVREKLLELEREGWVADIVVIDYADVMAPPAGQKDFRHQQNDLWQELRAISQERHCLVVTATQSDAKSYKTGILTRQNFSEDKRKLAHVTGMIGLNQSPEQKRSGLMGLNWVVRREAEASEYHVCWVAGSYVLCNLAMRALFPETY